MCLGKYFYVLKFLGRLDDLKVKFDTVITSENRNIDEAILKKINDDYFVEDKEENINEIKKVSRSGFGL